METLESISMQHSMSPLAIQLVSPNPPRSPSSPPHYVPPSSEPAMAPSHSPIRLAPSLYLQELERIHFFLSSRSKLIPKFDASSSAQRRFALTVIISLRYKPRTYLPSYHIMIGVLLYLCTCELYYVPFRFL
jgi:hypothetical protein